MSLFPFARASTTLSLTTGLRSLLVGLAATVAAGDARAQTTQPITGVGTSESPSATVCRDALWMAWKGQNDDTAIYVAPSLSGEKPSSIETIGWYYEFAPQAKVSGATPKGDAVTPATDAAPAIACLDDTLYLFWKNKADREVFWAQAKAPNRGGGAPSAPVLAWTAIEPINVFGVQPPSLNPNASKTVEVKHASTSAGPAGAVANGAISIAFKGDAGNEIWFATFNKTTNLGQFSTAAKLVTAGTDKPSTTAAIAKTDIAPAIAAIGDRLYFAWKGESDDDLWWTQISPIPKAPAGTFGAGEPVFALPRDANAWPQQKISGGKSKTSPTLLADGGGALWASWVSSDYTTLGSSVVFHPDLPVVFTHLRNGAGAFGFGAWAPPSARVGTPSSLDHHPAMVSTGDTSQGVFLAWKDPKDAGVTIGPLRLPAQTYTFTINSVKAVNTRSGSIASHLGPFSSPSSDTDYVTLAAQASTGGGGAVKGAWALGNLENGQSNTPYDPGPNGIAGSPGGDVALSVPDDSQVVMAYLVNNYGEGSASQEVQLLQLASEKLVAAGASAAAAAAGTALGTAIGAAIGADTVPVIGSALGALAGWSVGQAWGSAFPGCDGPVAAGVYALSAYDLYLLTQSDLKPTSSLGYNVYRAHSFSFMDLSPAPGSKPIVTQSGCGSNPIYDVYWTLSLGNHVLGGGHSD